MANNITIPLTNGSGGQLVKGDVVRASVATNNNVTKALATSDAGVQGLLGVVAAGVIGIGGPAQVAICGPTPVRLETGLTPVAGDTLYVSASVAGRATNVAPGTFDAPFGVILSAAAYGTTGTVSAAIGAV